LEEVHYPQPWNNTKNCKDSKAVQVRSGSAQIDVVEEWRIGSLIIPATKILIVLTGSENTPEAYMTHLLQDLRPARHN